MHKSSWLLAVSPGIFAVVAFVAGVIRIDTAAALAILQVMFFAAAFERTRQARRKQRGESVVMPMWQKILLGLLAAYGVLLVFLGYLTKQ